MNKAAFLKELRDILAGKLPPEELDDVLSYYEAYFADSEEDEQAVAERLGSPASVAEQVLKDQNEPPEATPVPQPGKQKSRAFLPVMVIGGAAILALFLYFFLFRSDPSGPVLLPGQTAGSVQTPDIQGDWEGEVEPFTKLDISIGLGNIQVEEGDQWHLQLINRGWDSRYDATQELKYSQDGDILSVWSVSDNIASGQSSPDVRVLVTVPAGTVLEQADLSLGMGNITWDGCAVKGRLQAESGMGNLSVSAPVEETTLTSGMGNITLDLAGSQEDYTWDLTTSSGTIRLNGETSESYSVSGGQGKHRLSLTSGMGNISLQFSQVPTAQPASTPTEPAVSPSPAADITVLDLPEGSTWLAVAAAGSEGALTVQW